MRKKAKVMMGIGVLLVSLSVSGMGTVYAETTAESKVNISFDTENSPLRIDSVSNILFGNQTLSPYETTYPANDSASISVTDNRGFNVSDGWLLTAQMSGFTNDLEESSLVGASLNLTNGIPTSQGNFTLPEAEN